MLYIIGIIALGKQDYQHAYDFLPKANIIEPSVVSAISRTGPSFISSKARRSISQRLLSIYLRLKVSSNPDRLRAFELAKGLANVNAALAFSIEQLMQSDRPKSTLVADNEQSIHTQGTTSLAFHIEECVQTKGNSSLAFSIEQLLQIQPQKPKSGASNDQLFQQQGHRTELSSTILLEDAAAAYQRAYDYKPNDPLFISNLAQIKLKLSDSLQPKESYDDYKLRLRVEAHQLLRKACRMKHRQQVKYAWLRMGHFQLRRGDLPQAVSFFQRAWADDPNFLVAARNLANTYSMLGEYDEAIRICDKALREVGSNRSHYFLTRQIHGWIHNSRGWAYLRKKIVLEARHQSRIHDSHQILNSRALLDLADADFQEALQLMNDSSSGQTTLTRLNQLFTEWEKDLSSKSATQTDFIGQLFDVLRDMPQQSCFTHLYTSLLCDGFPNFEVIFKTYWDQQIFIPSEYLGLIADFQLLKQFLQQLHTRHQLSSHQQSYIDDSYLSSLCTSLDSAIICIQEYLPACFLGLNYLWSGHPDRAVQCWTQRLERLYSTIGFEHAEEPSPAELNHDLWTYLYYGLISIYSGSGFPFLVVNSLPRFKQVYAGRTSEKTRQYALDLLTEAHKIGQMLIQRYPWPSLDSGGHDRSRHDAPKHLRSSFERDELRKLFEPVNLRYYSAIKQKFLLEVCMSLRRAISAIAEQISGPLRCLGKWANILFSP